MRAERTYVVIGNGVVMYRDTSDGHSIKEGYVATLAPWMRTARIGIYDAAGGSIPPMAAWVELEEALLADIDVEKHLPGQHDQKTHGRRATYVGITSARPPGAGGDEQNRAVFSHMEEFKAALTQIKGVSHVSVTAGMGAWEGGSEPTWVVSYRGNGEAEALVKATGKRFNQDAILLMRGGPPTRGSAPMAEMEFAHGLDRPIRKNVEQMMVSAGAGGWTWFKRNGKTVIRWTFVPQWANDKVPTPEAHHAAVQKLTDALKKAKLLLRTVEKTVNVEVIERADMG